MFVVKVLERKRTIQGFGIALMLAPFVNIYLALKMLPQFAHMQMSPTIFYYGALSRTSFTQLLSLASILIGAHMLMRGSRKSWRFVMVLLGAYIAHQTIYLSFYLSKGWVHGLFYVVNIVTLLFIADQLVWKMDLPSIPMPSPKPKGERDEEIPAISKVSDSVQFAEILKPTPLEASEPPTPLHMAARPSPIEAMKPTPLVTPMAPTPRTESLSPTPQPVAMKPTPVSSDLRPSAPPILEKPTPSQKLPSLKPTGSEPNFLPTPREIALQPTPRPRENVVRLRSKNHRNRPIHFKGFGLWGRLVAISSTGLQVQSEATPPEGFENRSMQIQFDKTLKLKIRFAKRADSNFHFEFSDLTPEKTHLLRQWLYQQAA